MTPDRPITDTDLNAYIDGALDQRRLAEVEAYLAAHPDIAARIAADTSLRQGLRDLHAAAGAEPVPDRLSLSTLLANRRSRQAIRPWIGMAAATLLLLTGGAGGWSLRAMTDTPRAGIASLAEEATESYAVYAPDHVRPVELDASGRAQLIDWASRRLDRPVSVPDLRSAGYAFMGGRLVATPHGPAVLYMFDNHKGVRLVMMIKLMAIDKNAPMARRQHNGVASVSWARDGMGYSLVGPMDGADLHRIANQARDQL